MTLAGLLFIGAVILFLVTLHLKKRWYKVAKKEATKSSPMSESYSAENTGNTIIMEEILQNFGHSITNGNSTR